MELFVSKGEKATEIESTFVSFLSIVIVVASWSTIDERRALCVRIRFLWTHLRSTWCGSHVHCRFPVIVRTGPRRAEICGGSTDAVPGQVVDMPVIVLTVVQMCRKLC